MTANTADDADLAPTIDRDDLDVDSGARGTLYALLARAFTHPDDDLYDALATGEFADSVASLLDRTTLDVDGFDPDESDAVDDDDAADSGPAALRTEDDYDTLCARYNDLFVVSFTEVEDRTDGTESSTAPPVPLYESSYRSDVSWTDVNLDLLRAYDFYGLEVDQSVRDHHDHLRYQLEFAGYLARRAAVADDGAPAARLDLLDRHLRVITEGMADAMADEPEIGAYGPLVKLLDAFTAADRRDLADRVEGE
ncbi:DMSO reductase family type II enzyme chaperone [Halomicrobium zhouii]|uniref:DMSO reductase family type II enzyme chaperone n=1 Tax=Halomicrobium zhouii TaxID=767519 RepID=A0A1I6K8T7_9EURY|nr:molecular chaperone TorD family protein [Halomicrobium zhouii]SFR87280.1 DMSO reductase family type II enzyme chaperone [Halomicrobium zhouii]